MASTMREIRFRVRGIPRPAGSKRPFRNPTTGKIVLVDASGEPGRNWRQSCQAAALLATGDGPLLEGPLHLVLTFYLTRPKGHFRTGSAHAGEVKPTARLYPTTRPDTTKLVRAVEDALTGIIWRDDSQVVAQTATKVYSDDGSCGVDVLIELWEGTVGERPW